MRERGASWVVVQAALLILLVLAPGGSAPAAYDGGVRLAGWIAGIIGMLLFLSSVLNLGRSFTPFPRPVDDGELVTHGVYRLVRHPMYLAAILVCLGFSLATASGARLLVTLVLFIFFDLKSRREERWLVERYPAYRQYQQQSKRLIPWVY
ncbi:isoprenylcysteine carboxylmethyltransferase family protein [Massilia sp. H6]|uniref:methyltransferase family protein n=1 Tax=Massilia sp. H6 TaxID=2970464 RepID=UPI00216823ED|nr:isoprenylcysteine carboxylmethyltransferase family protein [Massilia sp. H6]UVW29308.1 isoprenylcysteine carboxylmethyltransferase family protein [Massilia sp. H6]